MTPPGAAAAAGTVPAVHPRRAPLAPVRRPRRVSGPATRPARPAPKARRAANPAIAVTTHPLFDRLIHGRAWIAIIAFALIGIVTMQLGVLKLNAGIGRALEHEAALQRESSVLSVENSEVAAGDTVELQAAHMGMQLIPAGALRFLSARGSAGDLARAAAAARVSATSTSETTTSTETGTGTTATATSTASGESSSGGAESTSSTATPSAGSAETTNSASAQDTSAASAGAPSEAGASTPGSTLSQPAQTAPTPAPTGEAGGASASSQG